jgi:hypothetical protein
MYKKICEYLGAFDLYLVKDRNKESNVSKFNIKNKCIFLIKYSAIIYYFQIAH